MKTRTLVLVIAVSATMLGAVPYTFNAGDVLSSKAVNANFADLDQRVAAGRVVITNDAGVAYSIGATRYCNSSPQKTNGKIVTATKSGYAAAKEQCQSVCSSPSAHMCTAEELVRQAQMGTPTGSGWYSGGVPAMTPGPTLEQSDCGGWTEDQGLVGSKQQEGPVWTGNFPGYDGCGAQYPIVCCD